MPCKHAPAALAASQPASRPACPRSDARAYLQRCGLSGKTEAAPSPAAALASVPNLDALFAEPAAPAPLPAQYGLSQQAAQQAQAAQHVHDLGQLAALQAAQRAAPLPAVPELRASSAAARLMASAALAGSRASSLDTGTCTPCLSPMGLAAVSPGSASQDDGEAGGPPAHAFPAARVAPGGEHPMELPGLRGLHLPGPSLLGW